MTLNSDQQGAVAQVTTVFNADNDALVAARQETAQVRQQLVAANQQISDLQLALDQCQHPVPPGPGYMNGCSVNGPAFKGTAQGGLGYNTINMTRIFLRQLPAGSTWDNIQAVAEVSPSAADASPFWLPSVRSIPGDSAATQDLKDGQKYATDVLWISWKETDPKLVDAFFDTMPTNLQEQVWGTYHHEPEDDTASETPTQFKAKFAQMAPVMRDHKIKAATIFMRYTFSPGSGRDWHDWWPGNDNVDIFGCDSYNLGNKKGNYSDVTNQLQPIAEAAASVGKPWAIGETGASVFNGKKQPRADWAAALKAKAHELGALGMAWWDQDSYALDDVTGPVWFG